MERSVARYLRRRICPYNREWTCETLKCENDCPIRLSKLGEVRID